MAHIQLGVNIHSELQNFRRSQITIFSAYCYWQLSTIASQNQIT